MTYSSNGLKVGRSLVLVVVGVGNLGWCPDTLVFGVVNQRSGPLALVCRVGSHWGLPGTTARDFLTLGVRNLRGDPVTILLVIPVLGLLGLRVRDSGGLVLEPVVRLGGSLVNNLEWSVLVPVLWLGSLRVGHLSLFDPGGGLLVLGVVNLLLRVDRGGEVLEEGTGLDRLAVDLNLKRLVGVDNERVERALLGDARHGGSLEVLLLVLASLGVLVAEDEVDLVGGTALVGTEHDNVWGSVGELLGVKGLVVLEELHVGTTALQASCLVSVGLCFKENKSCAVPWNLASYCTTRVLPLLSMALGNLAEMAW